MEFISTSGLRLDGRRPKELRQLKCELGVLQSADGSAMFSMGNTVVSGACLQAGAMPILCGRDANMPKSIAAGHGSGLWA